MFQELKVYFTPGAQADDDRRYNAVAFAAAARRAMALNDPELAELLRLNSNLSSSVANTDLPRYRRLMHGDSKSPAVRQGENALRAAGVQPGSQRTFCGDNADVDDRKNRQQRDFNPAPTKRITPSDIVPDGLADSLGVPRGTLWEHLPK